MDNILLVFLDRLKDIQSFNKVIDEFDKREYNMYLYDNIKDTDFDFSELPDIIKFYRNQHNDTNKIVILSNLRDLIFAWYRCYNSIVDDFVYFIDEEENNYFNLMDKHYAFFQNLFDFRNINDEKIQGKIYLNIGFSNYINIIRHVLNNNFSYFDSIDNFSYDNKINKEIVIKEYIYKRYEYLFDFSCINSIKQTIRLNEAVSSNITIDNRFMAGVIDNLYIIPFLTIHFYKENNNTLTRILKTLFQQLKKMDKESQAKVFVSLFGYINKYCLDFKEKIYVASLLIMIHGGDERLTEFIMKSLLECEEYKETHYEILVNILFYISSEGLSLHDDYYLDQRNIINKLSKWIMKKEKLSSETNYKGSKRIAIVVDQLLSIRHSPTKVMLDYAKNIIKYYPEYEVKIFVEDNLYCSNKEKVIAYLYSSGISESCKEEHKSYLNNQAIKIYYCDLAKPKKNRTLDLVKEIDMFQPQAILTNSDISLTTRILYGTYPITYMSMGGDYFCSIADIYLCAYRDRIIQSNHKYGLLEESKIIEIMHGLEFNKPYKNITRKDYQMNEDDFIMVSVGNRLNTEMDEQFIDYLLNFIMKNDRVKWLIVGPKAISYLENKYNKLLGNKIITIKYEEDLQALYRICDVYVNPIRQSGGISIAMAMNEGLPVITTENSSAAAYYVGKENTNKNIEDCLLELNKIFTNKSYKKLRSEEVRKNIKKFEFEKVIKYLIQYL